MRVEVAPRFSEPGTMEAGDGGDWKGTGRPRGPPNLGQEWGTHPSAELPTRSAWLCSLMLVQPWAASLQH